ncbi:MAG: phosphoglycerate dehydrogenase [Caldilineales bacterium]|nr:phosphoglycerate dehydrogenase [Caldilineales bacterium]
MSENSPAIVLVSDPLAESGLEMLRQAGLQVDVRTSLSPAELIEAIPAYDALIVRSGTQVTADVLRAAHKMRVIARAGVGVDNVDVPAATRHGIIVANAPTGNVAAAAEHAVALMFALARHIPAAHASMAKGEWDRKSFLGIELRDKTLGLLGLGRVASHVARRAIGLDMQVIAYDPYVSAEFASNLGVELAPLDRVLAASDFISIHLPLTDQTRSLLNAERFGLCKKGVRIVNTSRGGVIDDIALAEALETGRVAGAALDVFGEEPPAADWLLRGHPGLIHTPHIGGSTSEAQDQVAIDAVAQVIDVLAGRPARYAVNAPLIPVSDVEIVAPYVDLVETLGRFLTQFQPMHIQEIELKVHGPIADYDATILKAAALRGLLANVVEERVNVVNAAIIAEQRGIILSERRQRHHYERFENMITLKVQSKGAERTTFTSVRGSVLGGEPYIVAIEDLWVDFLARGHFVLSWHTDQPGIIGAIGTLLGQHDINIAFMHVGRRSPRGEAIMVLNTDEPVPPDLLAEIDRIVVTHQARMVSL